MFDLRRRDFIALVGGAAAWPVVARAQHGERVRRIGVLMDWTEADAEGQARLAAFAQALKQLGWSDGRNGRLATCGAQGGRPRATVPTCRMPAPGHPAGGSDV